MSKVFDPERLKESTDKHIANLEVTLLLGLVGLGLLVVLSTFVLPQFIKDDDIELLQIME